MARALLVGAFGQRNPGDDALLSAFAAALPGWEIVVPSADPDMVTSGSETAGGRAGSAVGTYVTAIPNSPGRVFAALLSCDAVVVGGGTVFKLLKPSTGRRPRSLLLRAMLLTRGAKTAGKPVAIVGVGADDLTGRRARLLASHIAASADMLVVRDEDSADLLAAAGVPVPIRLGTDAVWTLLSDLRPAPAGREPAGAVLVTPSRHAKDAGRYAVLAASLTTLLRERPELTEVRIEPWQVGGQVGGRSADDLLLARELEAALRVAGCPSVEVIAPPMSVLDAAAGYRDAALVVGQRFHSLVAAAAAGCRFVADPSEPKLAAIARSFGQAVIQPETSVGVLTETLHAALDGPAPSREEVQRQTATARTMLGLMRTVLEGGRSGAPDELQSLTLRPTALVR
ncbi:MAG TPA: polysaccharide pyruvyl transferase family protein [Jatrophihabitans sp.]|jgi:polysaccharide pyruvyl transferase WcaK-like protein